jgi:hypothetical protein
MVTQVRSSNLSSWAACLIVGLLVALTAWGYEEGFVQEVALVLFTY